MATKLDLEKPLFMGPTAVRSGTTVDVIRQAVRDLDKGAGVPYGILEQHMLDNYKPGKSANYDGSFVKAYVRDAVNKYGHLTQEPDKGHEYSAIEPAPKKEAEPKAKQPTRAEKERNAVVAAIVELGEIADISDLNATQVTVEDIATKVGRKPKTVLKNLEAYAKDDFVRVEEKDGNEEGTKVTYVFVTENGFASLTPAEADGADNNEA